MSADRLRLIPLSGNKYRRWPASAPVALLLGALAATVALLAPGPAGAVGPHPDLGSCTVFPGPPASLSPNAPSLATEAAWNQNIAKAPRAANSAKVIAYIDSHGGNAIHPDFGAPRATGSLMPWSGRAPGSCRSTTPPTARKARPAPSRSRRARPSRAAPGLTATAT